MLLPGGPCIEAPCGEPGRTPEDCEDGLGAEGVPAEGVTAEGVTAGTSLGLDDRACAPLEGRRSLALACCVSTPR